jgi:DNA-binding HxlR family transcriptional regulator
MNTKKKVKEATCESEVVFHIIGGKWKPLILYLLFEKGTLRFGELQQSIPEVTHRILTKQLRELERDTLIQREVYPEVPPKVEYTITDKGKGAIPILDLMCDWASENNYFDYKLTYNTCDEG